MPKPLVKPRMRGWIHFWSFFTALLAGSTLIVMAAATVSGRAAVSVTIYVLTVLGLFGVSALYHRRHWSSASSRAWMKRLDHSMIFLFIAGTYTPFAFLALSPGTGVIVLSVIWGGAAAGVALKLLWPHSPRWVGVPIYIGLGWVAVFVMPEIGANAGVAALVLLIVGGVFYTVGAVFYATRWPDPWPSVFGYHEFFHATTVVAALCHYVAIWLVLYA
ncbi:MULTISPECIES: PAQR family membrane homeostasis protein TrhA [Actinoalloteichus]|uniref:Channel protein, hemolysin III family n=1 Tax=Actinoalloteichus fjordicus TaxID=1612552 RepID=A0AAC9LAM4_9PSEU|nr:MULTISPECIES: hemolysin III family protein [Actinoalloteichus]APU12895.1 channel protein, hemolysin III family [Actinoalloteichus fjordicus]APU18867.1 channel protein, hemolysin III family [Actinoalloteichus sp. GBA129-24]